MKTIQEINERLSQIAEELRKEDITTDQIKALQEEIRQLNAAKEELRKAAKQAEELRKSIADGNVPAAVRESVQPEGGTNSAEERANEFMRTKRKSIGAKETRAILVSGGTIATPTSVDGINDMPGNRVSSIVDLVQVEDCEGMGADLVAYVSAETAAASNQTEGSAGTGAEPTFGYVTIQPTSVACVAQISKQAKKQSPLNYEGKVTSLAYKSLRKKAAALIVTKLQASSLVDTVAATLDSNSKGKIDETTLRKIALAYGGDEDVVGGAVLFLNKKDLLAFGDVRGANEKKAVYEITPDTDNPNMGIIKDGGLSVRYCICSGLTECSGKAQTTTAIKTMFYGDPKCFKLDLFSGYEVRVSEDFAFTSLMDTIVGDAEIGGDVVVNKGFVTLQIAANP